MKNLYTPLCIVFLVMVACTPQTEQWVAIGDSITYLNEHPDETGNRISKGYMTMVVEELPHIKYINKGYNGWTAGDVAREIENLDLSPADIYSVFLGTNDWWRGRPVGTLEDYKNNSGNDSFFGSCRIIIDKLRTLNKNARIILITPLQRSDFIYIGDFKNNAYGSYEKKNGQELVDFAQAILSIGSHENFSVVDLYNKSGITQESIVKYKRLRDPETGEYKNYPYPDFIGIPFNPSTDEYPYPVEATDLTYDGLHPSDAGYAIIARMVAEALKE